MGVWEVPSEQVERGGWAPRVTNEFRLRGLRPLRRTPAQSRGGPQGARRMVSERATNKGGGAPASELLNVLRHRLSRNGCPRRVARLSGRTQYQRTASGRPEPRSRAKGIGRDATAASLGAPFLTPATAWRGRKSSLSRATGVEVPGRPSGALRLRRSRRRRTTRFPLASVLRTAAALRDARSQG